ncbi:uncharacterized protein L969DRAFT_163465 [Mixia osmundae IAM 14324]|uniref:uncharacterized protein n=1 Tax=Mixia osmundae (strain CBS 9802 / IAM 14324 / JCM 22182 / KY 12970) TaxID=764103 RepID=UPI0004A558AC|nr:uncharacterized protein L969DRAFT_163465 [Mixia osmundae IAM 14324]KEI42624.1 hypothetical protein L969DRAFT_163465 [Mixia osmundae IAM 14324]
MGSTQFANSQTVTRAPSQIVSLSKHRPSANGKGASPESMSVSANGHANHSPSRAHSSAATSATIEGRPPSNPRLLGAHRHHPIESHTPAPGASHELHRPPSSGQPLPSSTSGFNSAVAQILQLGADRNAAAAASHQRFTGRLAPINERRLSDRPPSPGLPGQSRPNPTLLKLDRETEACWMQVARLSDTLGNWQRAIAGFETALRHNPFNREALTQMARILRQQEEYVQAAELLTRALHLNENEGDDWGALGHCYLMIDELPKAYTCYQQALLHSHSPKSEPKLWYGIGILYDRYGSLEHAEEAFASVIKMDPSFDKANEIYFRLGIIYKQQQNSHASLSCFKYILHNPPRPLTEIDIWFQIGHVYEQQNEYEAAKDAYDRVLGANPTHAKVLQQLGGLYQRPKASFFDPELSVEILTRSLEHDPSDPFSWYLLGRAFMTTSNFGKAYEAYQQAVYRDGKNAAFWCSIGVLYYEINQFHDSLDAYSRAIRINPYISEVWFNLGALYESCNDQMTDAIDAYERTLSLDRNNEVVAQRLQDIRAHQRTGAPLLRPPQPIDISPASQSWQIADSANGPPSALSQLDPSAQDHRVAQTSGSRRQSYSPEHVELAPSAPHGQAHMRPRPSSSDPYDQGPPTAIRRRSSGFSSANAPTAMRSLHQASAPPHHLPHIKSVYDPRVSPAPSGDPRRSPNVSPRLRGREQHAMPMQMPHSQARPNQEPAHAQHPERYVSSIDATRAGRYPAIDPRDPRTEAEWHRADREARGVRRGPDSRPVSPASSREYYEQHQAPDAYRRGGPHSPTYQAHMNANHYARPYADHRGVSPSAQYGPMLGYASKHPLGDREMPIDGRRRYDDREALEGRMSHRYPGGIPSMSGMPMQDSDMAMHPGGYAQRGISPSGKEPKSTARARMGKPASPDDISMTDGQAPAKAAPKPRKKASANPAGADGTTADSKKEKKPRSATAKKPRSSTPLKGNAKSAPTGPANKSGPGLPPVVLNRESAPAPIAPPPSAQPIMSTSSDMVRTESQGTRERADNAADALLGLAASGAKPRVSPPSAQPSNPLKRSLGDSTSTEAGQEAKKPRAATSSPPHNAPSQASVPTPTQTTSSAPRSSPTDAAIPSAVADAPAISAPLTLVPEATAA